MSWIAVGVAVVGGVASYASAQSAEDQSEANLEAQIKAQKELAEQKRGYELEDRKYRQGAVGNWSKFLDPSLAPSTYATAEDGTVTKTEGAQHVGNYQRPVNGVIPSKFQFNWPVLPK